MIPWEPCDDVDHALSRNDLRVRGLVDDAVSIGTGYDQIFVVSRVDEVHESLRAFGKFVREERICAPVEDVQEGLQVI